VSPSAARSRSHARSRSNSVTIAVALAFACCATALPASPAQAAAGGPAGHVPSCPPPWLGSTTTISPTVSANGRFVAFDAMSPAYDDGGVSAVFLRDTRRGSTVPVALPTAGARPYGSVLSDDGSRVAYLSATVPSPEDGGRSHAVFVYDRRSGSTTAEGRADSGSELDLSADGRYLTYRSAGTDLWDWSITPDVYVRDLERDTVRLASVSTSGGRGNGASVAPTISADGRYVLFSSQASNLTADGSGANGALYVRDLATRRTTVVPAADGGTSSIAGHDAKLSPDGRYVVYVDGTAGRFRLHDRRSGTTVAVGPAAGENRNLGGVAVSARGRFVAYGTSYLVPAPVEEAFTQIYVHRLRTGTEVHATAGLDGDQPWRGSYLGALSPDGRYLVFASEATNLVPGDANDVMDVFRRDLRTGRTVLVSTPAGTTPGC
jgi:Tol biopolymer transport system component